jgi:hypothetical protein
VHEKPARPGPRDRVGRPAQSDRPRWVSAAVDPGFCPNCSFSTSFFGFRRRSPDHFEAQSPPFDLDASRAIYSPLTESHASINSSSAAEEQRSLRDTISEMRVMLVV